MNTTTTEAPTPQTAHTPGPWIASPVNHTGDCRVFAKLNDNQLYCTVEVGWGANARQVCEANARLIAAAPDLLAALERAAAYLQTHLPKGKIQDIFSELNEHENGVLKPALAAITKAKGIAQADAAGSNLAPG